MWDIYIVKITVNTPAPPASPESGTATKSSPILIHSDSSPLPEYKVLSPVLKLSDNSSGSLELTIPPNNAGYSQISCMLTEVIVKKDEEDYWFGRLLTVNEDFWKCKKCVFEGELSYLLDSIQIPSIHMTTMASFSFFYNWIQYVLNRHNTVTESYKHFELGEYPDSEIDMGELNGKDRLEITTNFENTLDVIRSNVLDILDVHLKIRHDNNTGKKYLDFLTDYVDVAGNVQSINFGENLLDYVSEINGNEYFTVMYPRGKKIEREQNDYFSMYTRVEDRAVNDVTQYYEKQVEDDTIVYRSVSPTGDEDPHKKNWYSRRDFFPTTDEMVVTIKKYYSRSITEGYAYDAIENPSSSDNPKSNGWYEKNGSNYTLTNDTTVNNNKTYYRRVSETVIKFTKVTPSAGQNPKNRKWFEEDIYNYFEEYATIVGIQSGYYDNNTLYIDGQQGCIYNIPGLKKFGYIYGIVDFEDIELAQSLAEKARQYMKKINYDDVTIQLTALDLHYLNPSLTSFNLLDKILCISEPHGLNVDTNDPMLFPVTDIEIDMLNPQNTKYTLSGRGNKGISGSTSNSNKAFSKYIVNNKTVSQSTVLEAAKSHADDLIKKSIAGSYASFVYTKNQSSDSMVYVDPQNPDLGYRATGIRVANAATDEAATSKWLWYSGGLGHYSRASVANSWGNPNVAITMDGSIVADFITAGGIKLTGVSTQTSDKTNGRTKSTYLQVFGSLNGLDNQIVGRWGSDGIWIGKGQITLGAYRSGSSNYGTYKNAAGTTVTARYPAIINDDGSSFFSNTTVAGKITAQSGSIEGALTIGANGYIGSMGNGSNVFNGLTISNGTFGVSCKNRYGSSWSALVFGQESIDRAHWGASSCVLYSGGEQSGQYQQGGFFVTNKAPGEGEPTNYTKMIFTGVQIVSNGSTKAIFDRDTYDALVRVYNKVKESGWPDWP